MNTFVPAYVEHLGVVSLDAKFLVNFGNSAESSRQSNRTQENHNHVDDTR
jgi:hypothetical protein